MKAVVGPQDGVNEIRVVYEKTVSDLSKSGSKQKQYPRIDDE